MDDIFYEHFYPYRWLISKGENMLKILRKKISIIYIVLVSFLINEGTIYASSPSPSVNQISSFIKGIIQIMAGLAGLVATAYFVLGGFNYITSSGNPHRLEKAKRTIFYSAIGLTITIAAFVISSIVTNLANSSFGG